MPGCGRGPGDSRLPAALHGGLTPACQRPNAPACAAHPPRRLPLRRLPQLGRRRAARLWPRQDRRPKREAGSSCACAGRAAAPCCCCCCWLLCLLLLCSPLLLLPARCRAWPLPRLAVAPPASPPPPSRILAAPHVPTCRPRPRLTIAPSRPGACHAMQWLQKIACTPNDGFVAKDDRTGGRIDSTAAVPIGRNGCYMQLPYMQYCLKVGVRLFRPSSPPFPCFFLSFQTNQTGGGARRRRVLGSLNPAAQPPVLCVHAPACGRVYFCPTPLPPLTATAHLLRCAVLRQRTGVPGVHRQPLGRPGRSVQLQLQSVRAWWLGMGCNCRQPRRTLLDLPLLQASRRGHLPADGCAAAPGGVG